MADNMDLKKNIPEQEEKGIAMEILGELKRQNERLEGFNKRIIAILIVVLCLWFSTIGGFVWYLSQYEFTSYTVDSKDGGNANFIGNDGDINNYGESEGNQKNEKEQEGQGNGN